MDSRNGIEEEHTMIGRYQTAEMNSIWSEESKFSAWLEVELAVCRVWMEKGVIPADAYGDICEKASFDIGRINEIEEQVHHDVIAFVSAVAEKVGENGRYIHLGLTSSDVIDTASSLSLKRSFSIVKEKTEALMEVIARRAEEFKYTPCVGRTQGSTENHHLRAEAPQLALPAPEGHGTAGTRGRTGQLREDFRGSGNLRPL
jgi:adenylosuccinate lyase